MGTRDGPMGSRRPTHEIRSRDAGRAPRPAGSGARGTCGARGAAIVTVLLIVTLATVVVSGLFWRQHVTVRSVENRLSLAQTRWIERAAVDWARVILRVDGATNAVDWLGEPWAIPVGQTLLDETVTGGARFVDANSTRPQLEGQILDAQSRLNLNNLVVNGVRDEQEIEAFRRLLSLLGRSPALAEQLVARLLRASPPPANAAGLPSGPPTALRMKRLADLRELPGFDEDTVRALEPFAIFLPAAGQAGAGQSTKININTAPAEVIAARIPDLNGNLGTARAFVTARERQRFYVNVAAAGAALPGQPTLTDQRWSVSSGHFLLRGVIRYERVVSRTDTLLARREGAQSVEVLWQDRY